MRPFRPPPAGPGDAPVTLPLREVPPVPAGYRGGGPDALMAAAQSEAAALMAEAMAERERASAVGYADGLEQGRMEAMAAVREAVDAMGAAAGLVQRALAQVEEELEPQVVALALEVAARLVRAEVAARPEHVMDVVRGALRRVTDRERIIVRVNPDDLAICRAGAADLLEHAGGIGRLDFVDDPRVGRGCAVLETNTGDVDATFGSQLARIHEALLAPPDARLVQ